MIFSDQILGSALHAQPMTQRLHTTLQEEFRLAARISLFSDGFEEPNLDSSDWNNNKDLLSRKANDDDNFPLAFKQIMQPNTNYRHD